MEMVSQLRILFVISQHVSELEMLILETDNVPVTRQSFTMTDSKCRLPITNNSGHTSRGIVYNLYERCKALENT